MKYLGKVLIVAGFIAFIAAFVKFDLSHYFSLEYLKTHQATFADYHEKDPVMTIGLYMLIYIINTAASLPTAAVLTLLGGALFGTFTGTIIVSFASTIGATLAFLASRYLFKNWVQEKFGSHLININKGIEEEGAFYLFSIRMIPAIPFFVVNLVMGLTPIKTRTYFIASQVGMLAGTIVYVNAGTHLGRIESLSGILSPKIILSFILLALFPIITKKLMSLFKKKGG